MNYKLIFNLVLVGLLVIFIIQNVAVVEIRFLFWKVSMSRSIMIFLVLAVGIITGWMLRSRFGSEKSRD
ncbi:MAG: LapA family protein [Deltaproteobacteria bacterium]|nr:LapA family protein [Deltaproteobacteria bacterium]MBW1967471.1 LapA family protein [Deltaproteobacteria bacterium]